MRAREGVAAAYLTLNFVPGSMPVHVFASRGGVLASASRGIQKENCCEKLKKSAAALTGI